MEDGSSTEMRASDEHSPQPGPSTIPVKNCISDQPTSVRAGITVYEMVLEHLHVAIPTIVSVLVMVSSQAFMMSFVGQRLGYLPLAKFSIGLSVFNVCGASLGVGFSSALDTLAPQAIGRNRRTPEVGEQFQRAMLFNTVFFLPVTLLFYGLQPLLLRIFGETLGSGASEFLRASPPYLYLLWMGWVVGKLFSAQKLAQCNVLASFCGTITVTGLCHLYLHEDDSLVKPVLFLAAAQLVVNTVNIIVILKHPKCIIRLAKFPADNLLNRELIREHFSIAMAGTLQTCSEWWAFEAVQVIAAQAAELPVAVYTILFNVLYTGYRFPHGVAIGGAVVIGNSLGANSAALAWKYAQVSASIGLSVAALTVGTLYRGVTLNGSRSQFFNHESPCAQKPRF